MIKNSIVIETISVKLFNFFIIKKYYCHEGKLFMQLKNNHHFYFGASTSSFQVEGGAHLDGKSSSIWDEYTQRNFFIPPKYSTQREINSIETSSDFYHKFKEDIQLMKEQGLQMFRFSISWSRIYPKNEFKINKKGLEFYHKIINELLKNNIEPVVTLFHWDLPVWIQCKNGFLNREIIDLFAKYSKTIFYEFGQKVKYFITFNEMMIFNQNQFIWAQLTPEYKNRSDLAAIAMHNCHLSCAKSVLIFKNLRNQKIVRKDALIGISHTNGPIFNKFKNDTEAQEHANLIGNLAYFEPSLKGYYPKKLLLLWKKFNYQINITKEDKLLLKENTHEFLGYNYYQPIFVTKTKKFGISRDIYNWTVEKIPKTEKVTKWNWIINPQLLTKSLINLNKKYKNILILITENGYGDFDLDVNNKIFDIDRIEYIKMHLEACYKAINDYNVNLLGYCYWSFQDLFSPSSGYRKRYGFVKIDFKTLKRSKKLSYFYYRNLILSNNYETNYNEEKLIQQFLNEE